MGGQQLEWARIGCRFKWFQQERCFASGSGVQAKSSCCGLNIHTMLACNAAQVLWPAAASFKVHTTKHKSLNLSKDSKCVRLAQGLQLVSSCHQMWLLMSDGTFAFTACSVFHSYFNWLRQLCMLNREPLLQVSQPCFCSLAIVNCFGLQIAR